MLQSSVHWSPTLLSLPVVTSTPHRSTGSPLAAATSHKVDPLEQLHSVSLPPVFSIHLAPSWQLPPACTWHSLLVQPARPPVRHRHRLHPSGLQVSPACLATPSLSWPQSRVWAIDKLTRQKKAMMPIELEKSRIFDISVFPKALQLAVCRLQLNAAGHRRAIFSSERGTFRLIYLVIRGIPTDWKTEELGNPNDIREATGQYATPLPLSGQLYSIDCCECWFLLFPVLAIQGPTMNS